MTQFWMLIDNWCGLEEKRADNDLPFYRDAERAVVVWIVNVKYPLIAGGSPGTET